MITFFGVPREQIENISPKTICLLGAKVSTPSFHTDYDVIFAPDLIRLASLEVTTLPYSTFQILDYDVIDLGNISVETLPMIIKEIVEKNAIPVVIGGDHITTYFALKQVNFKNLLWFDAHLDLHQSEKYISHESALLHIIKNHVNASYYVIGFRSFSSYPEELEFAKKHNVKLLPWPFNFNELNKILKKEPCFISIDLDFFNPRDLSAVRVPELSGPSLEIFLDFISTLKLNQVKYIDIVEYAPAKDRDLSQAKKIARLLLTIISKLVN